MDLTSCAYQNAKYVYGFTLWLLPTLDILSMGRFVKKKCSIEKENLHQYFEVSFLVAKVSHVPT